MKYLTSPLLLVILSIKLPAQTPSQIRLKTGFSLLFPSPGGKGYAFKGVNGTDYSVVIGGEYSKSFRNRKKAWHIGFTFQDSYAHPSPNEKNIIPVNLAAPSPTPGSISAIFYGAPAKTEIYAGMEWFIKRDLSKPHKNYFSVIAGVGFAFTLNKYEDWPSRPLQCGIIQEMEV